MSLNKRSEEIVKMKKTYCLFKSLSKPIGRLTSALPKGIDVLTLAVLFVRFLAFEMIILIDPSVPTL